MSLSPQLGSKNTVINNGQFTVLLRWSKNLPEVATPVDLMVGPALFGWMDKGENLTLQIFGSVLK